MPLKYLAAIALRFALQPRQYLRIDKVERSQLQFMQGTGTERFLRLHLSSTGGKDLIDS